MNSICFFGAILALLFGSSAFALSQEDRDDVVGSAAFSASLTVDILRMPSSDRELAKKELGKSGPVSVGVGAFDVAKAGIPAEEIRKAVVEAMKKMKDFSAVVLLEDVTAKARLPSDLAMEDDNGTFSKPKRFYRLPPGSAKPALILEATIRKPASSEDLGRGKFMKRGCEWSVDYQMGYVVRKKLNSWGPGTGVNCKSRVKEYQPPKPAPAPAPARPAPAPAPPRRGR